MFKYITICRATFRGVVFVGRGVHCVLHAVFVNKRMMLMMLMTTTTRMMANVLHVVARLLALVYYAMAASTGVEVANFNLAYLCEGNHVSRSNTGRPS